MKKTHIPDPMEQLIRDGLNAGAFRYVDERHPDAKRLDFLLVDLGVHIEVKRMHSDRIADQMSRAPNVIAAQGDKAVRLLAMLLADARYRRPAPAQGIPTEGGDGEAGSVHG